MPSLADLLSTSAAEIARHLNVLDPHTRLEQTLALSPRQQATLFELAEGHRVFTLDDLAPATTTPLLGVRHEGRNSLYAFTRFAKSSPIPMIQHSSPPSAGASTTRLPSSPPPSAPATSSRFSKARKCSSTTRAFHRRR